MEMVNKDCAPASAVKTSEQELKLIALRWFEFISEHKVKEISEITASNWVMHGGPPGLSPGPAGARELFRTIASIDQQWAVEDIIVEGDKVVVRAINTCIQECFLGIPGIPDRGRRQVFTVMFIHRIAEGKIAETWRNADDLGRLIQLGVFIEELTRPGLSGAFGLNASNRRMLPGLKPAAEKRND